MLPFTSSRTRPAPAAIESEAKSKFPPTLPRITLAALVVLKPVFTPGSTVTSLPEVKVIVPIVVRTLTRPSAVRTMLAPAVRSISPAVDVTWPKLSMVRSFKVAILMLPMADTPSRMETSAPSAVAAREMLPPLLVTLLPIAPFPFTVSTPAAAILMSSATLRAPIARASSSVTFKAPVTPAAVNVSIAVVMSSTDVPTLRAA